jgi:hypothetical protein
MTETSLPKQPTMTMTKRNRNNLILEHFTPSPNPKDKKAQCSILKAKSPEPKAEETKKKQEKEKITNEMTQEPTLNRKTIDKDQIKSTLSHKFDEIYNEETTANNNMKNGNEEADNADKDTLNKESKYETQAEPYYDNKEVGPKANKGYKESKAIVKTTEGHAEGEYKQIKNDIDKMNEDKYCLDLQNNGLKQHTSAWKTIPEAILKTSSSFTAKYKIHIKELMKNIGEVMNKEPYKLDKDSWIKILIKTKDIIAARNKKGIVRIFGISLASSDPKELFSQDIFDGNKMLETQITAVWAAVYTIYGPGWIREKK